MTNIIGSRIKALRERSGLNQKELASKLQIANSTMSQYESGQRIPSDDLKLKIAELFNASTDYLLGRTDDPLPVRNVDQDLRVDQDVESQWHAFVDEYSKGTSMFYQYENVSDEQKLLIMQEYKEKLEKKKKKVLKFMDFSDEVIDEALNFAAYNEEQRKKKLDD